MACGTGSGWVENVIQKKTRTVYWNAVWSFCRWLDGRATPRGEIVLANPYHWDSYVSVVLTDLPTAEGGITEAGYLLFGLQNYHPASNCPGNDLP